MSVKRGYKQTEVGVIPEEWEVRPCSSLSERIMVGIVIRPSQYYVKHGVPALRSANIRESGITDTDLVYISERSNAMLAKSQVRVGDVLTVRTGYPGTSAVVTSAFAGSNCIDVLITRPSRSVSAEYLSIWINSPRGKSQVLESQGGLAQQHFNVGDLRNLIVALPQLPEQRAIAGALSDVDALIASLDRLIAKKRDLKRAAMQQLLTGQTRLPGFGGKWEVVPLGKVGAWFSGGTPSKGAAHYWTGDIPWVSPKDMKLARLHDAIDHVSVQAIGNGTRMLPVGAILVVVRGMILAHSAPVARAERPLAFNQDIKGLVVRDDIDSNFMLWWLIANELVLLSKTNESTHGTKRIPTESLFGLRVQLPSFAEQSAIAAVLSDMDAELAALEQRRDKTKLVKQGMMQELLTGKTRLV